MGIHEVDWNRYLDVESRATSQDHTALGDPARWGGESVELITADGVFAGQQLIRVQTRDPYARTWQLLGTLSAPAVMWALDAASWVAELEVTMGTGQVTVLHRFNLRALIALASPWYVTDGLVRPWAIGGGLIGRALSARVVHTMVSAETITGPTPVSATALITPLAAGSEL
jgi:hypothetical protein